jgi:hypothetical protein
MLPQLWKASVAHIGIPFTPTPGVRGTAHLTLAMRDQVVNRLIDLYADKGTTNSYPFHPNGDPLCLESVPPAMRRSK